MLVSQIVWLFCHDSLSATDLRVRSKTTKHKSQATLTVRTQTVLACRQSIKRLKRTYGERHPWGLWGDCRFACEHLSDNEEPDWGTAISEPFVIFPTGQNLIGVTLPPGNLTLHPTLKEAAVKTSGDGTGVTWKAFIVAAPPRLRLHTGDAESQRRRDTEPQVPTSLADKSNLSLWPLTRGVAMEPSSRGRDGACWDCSQQGRVNMGCCENY